MAKILEYVAGSEGDPSVGMDSHYERITVIFHDRNDKSDMGDDVEILQDTFAEINDGWCVPKKKYDEDCIKDRIVDALRYEDWRREHPEEAKKTQAGQ